MDEPVLEDLVQRVRNGHPAAIDEVLSEFRPRIYRFALSRLGDPHNAEDVTQETCMALANALPNFEDRGVKVSSFVFAIANNKIADLRRKESRRPATTSDDVLTDQASGAAGPEDIAAQHDQLREISGPLSKLPERDRQILMLRVVGQLSADEVAETLKMTPGAVRVAQHRALKALRAQLKKGVTV